MAKHYVDAAALRQALIDDDEAAYLPMLKLIAEGTVATKFSASKSAGWRFQEAVADVWALLWQKRRNVDLNQSPRRVFNYFSTVAINATNRKAGAAAKEVANHQALIEHWTELHRQELEQEGGERVPYELA